MHHHSYICQNDVSFIMKAYMIFSRLFIYDFYALLVQVNYELSITSLTYITTFDSIIWWYGTFHTCSPAPPSSHNPGQTYLNQSRAGGPEMWPTLPQSAIECSVILATFLLSRVEGPALWTTFLQSNKYWQ